MITIQLIHKICHVILRCGQWSKQWPRQICPAITKKQCSTHRLLWPNTGQTHSIQSQHTPLRTTKSNCRNNLTKSNWKLIKTYEMKEKYGTQNRSLKKLWKHDITCHVINSVIHHSASQSSVGAHYLYHRLIPLLRIHIHHHATQWRYRWVWGVWSPSPRK